MANISFAAIPAEITIAISQYLDPADILSFRLASKQCYAQTFDKFADRFFSTCTTSLMGPSLARLEDICRREDIRQYIKTIVLKDSNKKCNVFRKAHPSSGAPSSSAMQFWSRSDTGLFDLSEMGLESLARMIRNGSLSPKTIKIRDHGTQMERIDMSCKAPASFAKDIIELVESTVVSITIAWQAHLQCTEAHIDFSPNSRGKHASFSLLRTAHLTAPLPYWAEKVLYQSPALQTLFLRFNATWKPHDCEQLLSAAAPIPQLREVHIAGARALPARVVLAIISASKSSLTSLHFQGVTLVGSTWRDFLSTVATDFTSLESFSFRAIRQGSRENYRRDMCVIEFLHCDVRGREGLQYYDRTPNRMTAVRYNGLEAREVLSVLAANTVRFYPDSDNED